MNHFLRWLLQIAAIPLLLGQAWAEGSKQLTPNTPATAGLALSDPANTRSGYLTHDVNFTGGGITNTSLGFLKPNGYNYNGVTFSEDHRMYVRVKAGETLLYGVHRTFNGQIAAADNQRDLILTLRYGTGAGTQVQQTTLTRDQASANQTLLTTPQTGVIATAAQAQAGPLPNSGGYSPLSYTNNTGADQEFYLEFTQVGEGTPGAYDNTFTAFQRYSTYDFWDLTVRTSGGTEQPGRLHAKLWSFSAGQADGRFSSTFNLFPLIPDPSVANRYYVKQFELAGLAPQNFFRFTTNSKGTTASATDFTVSRRSQTVASGFSDYPEFDNYIQNPDPTIWLSTTAPTFSVKSVAPFCGPTGSGQLAFTTTSTVGGTLIIVVDLDGTAGYQPGGRDVVVEKAVPPGVSTVFWNGQDGLGAAVPSGTAVTLNFKSGAAPINFPVVDAEDNIGGFRIQDVRPTTGFDLLFWDDTNLTTTKFPAPQANAGGVLSSGGVHTWGSAVTTDPTYNAGDLNVVNTYTFGNVNAVDRAYTLTYTCDGDGDGITDANDIDWDNDGISNTTEGSGVNPVVLTANNVPTYLDAAYVHPTLGAFRDINGDGINDVFDLDLDGKPDFFDIDADNDGITDVIEANASGAVIANYDPNTGRITGAVGANGMPDAAETTAENGVTKFPLTNTDGTGRPDYLDIDADGDGIPDNIEGQPTATYRAPTGTDTDGDGLDDRYDPTPGGAVTAGTAMPLTNTDGADQPDYRDTDSDNDGRLDNVEGWDTNNDGVADTTASGTDTDQDGLDNAYDTINLIATNSPGNAQNGRLPTFYPDVNKPGGDRDWRQVLNAAPVAQNITNAPAMLASNAITAIQSLVATDADDAANTLVYTIAALPPASQGVLYVNGVLLNTTNFPGLVLTATQATQLQFDPAVAFTGNATFNYSAKDPSGLIGNTASYTIPVVAPLSCQPSYLDNVTTSSGLTAEYYAGYYNDDITYFQRTAPLRRLDPIIDFSTGDGSATWGDLSTVATGSTADWNTYSSRYRGSIYITTAGSYTFYVNSDDAAYLWLDGAALAPTIANATVNDGGQHGVQQATGTVTLTAGLHDLTAVFGENGGGNYFRLEYESVANNIARQVVPQSLLCAGPATTNNPPVANNATNQTLINTAAATTLNPNFSGTDPDGNATLSYYNVVTLPSAASGVLFYNAVAVVAGQAIPVASINLLSFDPAAGFTGSAAFTYTVTDNGGRIDLTPATYTIPVLPPSTTVSGTVFEDVSYGGGAGRPASTAGTSGRPNATVELYDASGNYLTSTTTNASGQYTFASVVAGTYSVRVVDATVSSSRNTGNVAGLLPVQTFVRQGGTTDDVNRVGGEAPAKVDAAANTGAQTLGALTAGNATPQSITSITVAATPVPVSTVDFGFNFDVITNTNDTGQGSLRQFILNSNALPNTGLDQVASSTGGPDPAAGIETSIFMIPRGTATAGIRAGVASGLNAAGVAVITPATATAALPAITDAGTSLNGTTQTQNVGNTNNVTLGTGGTVGTNATALGQVNGPEVQIVGTPGQANSEVGLDLRANNTTVTGFSIYGFGNTQNNTNGGNIRVTSTLAGVATTGTLITGNVIGTAATTFPLNGTDPNTVTTRSTGNGIYLTVGGAATTDLFGAVISNNLIGYNGTGGVEAVVTGTSNGSTTGVIVTGNEIRGNAILNNAADGIRVGVNGGYVANNLFQGNQGPGVDFAGSAGNTTVTNNTISNNGLNGSGQTPGIRMLGTNNTVSLNVISNNYGAGVLAQAGTTSSIITQNAIFGNGTILSASGGAASGQIGIDLLNATDNANQGTGPFVTLNDGTTTTGTGNSLLDFPILQTASVIGNNLVINGISRPGVTIEFFLRDGTAGNFGQGQTYLGNGVENGTGDTNTSTATVNYSGLINGLNQGTDNTNSARGFTITVPIGSLTAAQRTALLANGLTATATQTGVGTSEFSGRLVPIVPVDLVTTVTGPATVAAGQPSGTYTATFSNLGPNSTTGATRSVAVPTGSTFTAAQTTAITAQGGSVSGTTITFPVSGTLAPNATTSFTFAFTAPTTTGAATVVSTVGAGTGTTDTNTANNTSTLNLTVTPVSDLVATITGNGPVAVGGAGTFTATFTNNGPNGPATGTSATVQLPAGLGTVTFSGTTTGVTTSYNNATGVVSFTGTPLTSLATGAGVATTINYTQPATGSGVTATAAIATTSNQAGQTGNDAQTATNATTISADVATSILGPTSITLGGQATYNVLTTNNGPNTATNVVQTVTLLAGATNVFITGGGVLSGNTVTFPAISLANGQTVNNTVSFTAPGAATTSYNTVANVTAAQDAATTGNNTATTATSITAPAGTNADLNVILTTSAASAAPSTVVTFTLKQANDGVSTGTGVVSTLNLPAGLTTTTLTLPGATGTLLGNVITFAGGGTLYNTASYNILTGVLTFPTVAAQTPGAASTNTYLVNVTTPASGVVSATGAVRGTTPDNEPGNNVASAQTTVNTTNATDLATTLNGPNSATPGQSVSYTVTTTNNGPQPATNVVQTVSIPAGLPITGANAVTIGGAAPTSTSLGIATYAGGATYNSNTGVVTYPTIATLPNAGTQSSVITYVAPANNGTTVANTAVVSGNGTDPTLTNNAATVLTALTPSADVQVTISGPASAIQGNPVTYGVTTTNNGTSPAASVATTVQLPTGLTGVVVRDAAGNTLTNSTTTGYNSADGIVRFPTLTSQAPGATGAASGTITLLAPAAGNGPLVPVATVASTTADPNAGNNSATAVTSVQPATTIVADLSTNLTSSVASQAAGSPVTFTVTTASAGTSTGTATGVVQTVQLPAGLTTNGGTVTVSNSGTYDNATGVVTFPAITLAPGASVSNTIVLSQAPGVDPLVAVATVGGDQTDPSTGNNTFVLNVPITAAPNIATSVTGPASASPGQTVSYTVVTSNVGTTPALNATQTLSIPAGVTSYSLNGGAAIPVTGPATITIPVPGTIYPGAANGVTNTVTFTAPTAGNLPYTVTGFATTTGDAGTTGNNTSAQTTSATAAGPVAANVVNSKNGASPMANDAATARPISSLSATGGTGTLRYTVTSLPPTSQGVLYLADGVTPVTAGTLLAAGAEATLTFKPAAGFVGNATFLYTATDNNGTGRSSNTATFLIPVNGDLASVYYTNTSKGGATPYKNGNEIARVFDPNGGIATDPTYTNPDPTTTTNGTGNGNATKVPDNGVRSAVTTGVFSTTPYPGVINNLSDLGLVFDATTGQLVVGPSAAELAKLARRQGTYTFAVTTTDVYGGVTTQNVTFTIGNFPLPVELTDFTAVAVRNLDASLLWHTAQEKNNDHFDVERSLNGTDYVKIAAVQGQGSKTTPTEYALTDAGIGPKAKGLVYYRLKQVDTDGETSYSPVRTVTFTAASVLTPAIALFPNPATTGTQLDLRQLPTGTYQVSVLDATGRVVLHTMLEAGLAHALDLNTIASGTYNVLVRGQANGQTINLTKRLIKD